MIQHSIDEKSDESASDSESGSGSDDENKK